MPDSIIEAYDRDTSEPQQVRASVSEFKGQKYFSIRGWFLDEKAGDYRPGKNGVNLPVDEYWRFRDLVDALDEALGYKASESPSASS